ncbi:MAG: TonB family protein [Bdellovibrionales bacterium]|nr:TonB family protein [Bdellovibrionales bacterium]
MGESRFDKAFQALIISLLIHIAVSLIIYLAPEPKIVDEPITVELIDAKSASQTIVDETEKNEDLLEKLKTQSQLLSKYNKRVEKEQIAQNKTGETQNRRGNSNQNQQPSLSKNLNLAPQVKHKPSNEGVGEKQPKVNPLLNSGGVRGSMNNSVALGESTSGQDIPGVQSGSFTALNTDQFTYYSFFERVNNAIRYRWITGVRNFVRDASPKTINQLAKIPTPTVVRILLDKDGMVVRVDIIGSSGSKTLDQTVIDAFYQASPLNHPPDGMVQEDRMVHLNYSFKVLFRPVYVADGDNTKTQ